MNFSIKNKLKLLQISKRLLSSTLGLLLIQFVLNCFAHVSPKNTDKCEKIGGIPGPEDMALDRENGILYVSSHERRIEGKTGEIFMVNLNEPILRTKKAIAKYPKRFRPHGIHLVKVNGKLKLYAISHKDLDNDKHSIEVFSVDKNNLKHESTLEDAALESPNDLFVLPDGRIFVSNDHPKGSYFKKLMIDVFRIRSSKISYFDGSAWTLLLPQTVLGNGILITKKDNKEILYWASTIDEKVMQFEIINQKNSPPKLKLIKEIDINSGADNLEEEESGTILVGAHKSLFRFLRHSKNGKVTSPSQIFRFDYDGNLEEIFSSDGEEISASSTGISYKGKLIIGQVFEPFLLSCPLK
ncbi:MAG: arylesterase [Leptospiraceae bacterium]|nr:arylesterase [Leptospiraceae bacterium]